MADDSADCPMAHMIDLEKISEVRHAYRDVAAVCYVNSIAEIKAASDIYVTSFNALRVVKNLPEKIYFSYPIIILENMWHHCFPKRILYFMTASAMSIKVLQKRTF